MSSSENTPQSSTSSKPIPKSTRLRRWVRRLLWTATTILIVLVLAMTALPYWLSGEQGRTWLLSKANARLAPYQLDCSKISISWIQPTQLSQAVLRDSDGTPLIQTDQVIWDRRLHQILFDRPNYGLVDLGQANLQVERGSDGSIDLHQALKPLFTGNPKLSLYIQGRGGKIRIHDVASNHIIDSQDSEFFLGLNPAPALMDWRVVLKLSHDSAIKLPSPANSQPDPGAVSIAQDDGYIAPKAPSTVRIDPPLVVISGNYDRWRSPDDPSTLPRLNGVYDVRDWPVTWNRPIGGAQTSGAASAWIRARQADGDVVADFLVDVGDLRWDEKTLVQQVVVPIEGQIRYQGETQSWEWSKISVKHPQATLWCDKGRANSESADTSSFKLPTHWETQGRLELNWESLNQLLANADRVKTTVKGSVVEWSASQKASSSSLDFSASLNEFQAESRGLKFGPTALKGRWNENQWTIDPIRAPLNGGLAILEPIIRRDDQGTWRVQLGSGTKLEKVQIDDQVSHEVLSYIAPVLDKATRVRGSISGTLETADWPLKSDQGPTIEGRMVFENVRFLPGPLAMSLVNLIGANPERGLEVNQPVKVRIEDGFIHQTGLAVNLGPVAKIGLEGKIGLNRSLNLNASIAMSDILANRTPAFAASLTRNARLTIPITGTLSDPKIDGTAFREKINETGKRLMQQTAIQGTMELFNRIGQRRANRKP